MNNANVKKLHLIGLEDLLILFDDERYHNIRPHSKNAHRKTREAKSLTCDVLFCQGVLVINPGKPHIYAANRHC